MVLVRAMPAWVTTSAQQMHDLRWIAYRVAIETGCERSAGVAAAIAWIHSERFGPITARDEQPVTQQIATAEWWSAISMATTGTPPPVWDVCRQLHVTYWDPQPVQTTWAQGVEFTLEWLLGEREKSPLSLPVRHPDGRVCTEDDLYEAAVAVRPHAYEHPEQQIPLREKCRKVARKSRELVRLIEDTRRKLEAA